MKQLGRCLIRALAAALAAATGCGFAGGAFAQAGGGLAVGSTDWLWPQLQARITVHTATLAPVRLVGPAEAAVAPARSVQGGSLLGDYVFATPSIGHFRATSGLMLGGPGGAPWLSSQPSARLGLTVTDLGPVGSVGGNGAGEGPATLPYVGLGYSSATLWRSLAVSADVGLVAGRPSGLTGLGRAMFGSPGTDAALRELRLAPVLQLGVRYSF